MNIADLRQDYRLQSLDTTDAAAHPLDQFQKWFQEALHAQILEPNAMVLATATPEGRPSARVVLLKGIEDQGFVFYTNYDSQKGQELSANPLAALCFNWLDLQRQVRIEGRVERHSAAASEAYFKSRPKGSQIGAWASPQSQVVANRQVLEDNYARLEATHAADDVLPKPEHWGGFIVRPTVIEFWQGRSSRLHDRLRYTEQPDGTWQLDRLAP